MRAMGRKGMAATMGTGARTAGRPRWGSILVAAVALSVLGAAAAGAAAAVAADPKGGHAAPAAAAAKPAAAPTPAPGAAATLESADDPKLSGTVTFTQLADAVRIEINVAGADHPGPHGVHLHENGKCEHDPAGKHYTSAGGHFNPTAAPHACRESTTHHAGDFGNIEIQPDGTGHLVVVTSMLSLRGPTSPIGKAIILHTGADDCKTQPTGNSGGRLACGLVQAEGAMAH
jgi:Cu-Zn family superoxide dismutase